MLRIWATLWGAIGVMLAAHGLIAAPAEDPPDDFAARQYIDSQGCVFLRDEAGAWQSRQARDGQPVCGYPPTFSSRGEEDAPAGGAGPGTDEIADKLMTQIVTSLGAEALGDRVGGRSGPEANPRDKENGLMSAAPLEALNRTIQLNSAVKHAMGDALRPNKRLCELLGGQALSPAPAVLGADATQGYCGDFIALDFRRLPVASSDARDDVTRVAVLPPPIVDPVTMPESSRPPAKPALPPRSTAAAPAKLAKVRVSAAPPPAQEAPPAKALAASPETPVKARVLRIDKDRARPLPPIPRGARYVQVGVFGNAANAERSVAALERLKLPLSRGKGHIKGRNVDIILAGPFDDPWKLADAMRAVRASGYPDAYPR